MYTLLICLTAPIYTPVYSDASTSSDTSYDSKDNIPKPLYDLANPY